MSDTADKRSVRRSNPDIDTNTLMGGPSANWTNHGVVNNLKMNDDAVRGKKVKKRKREHNNDITTTTIDKDIPPHIHTSSSNTATTTTTTTAAAAASAAHDLDTTLTSVKKKKKNNKKPTPLELTPSSSSFNTPLQSISTSADLLPSTPPTTQKSKKHKRDTDIAADDMPNISGAETETWTSPNGSLLTFTNAGTHLTHWAQAIGHTLSFVYIDIPPDSIPTPTRTTPSKRAMKRAIQNPLSPPLPASPIDPLRACSLTLPVLGTVRSSGLGWRNKSLAKRSASFTAVRRLYTLREIDDDFRPTPSMPKAKVTSPLPDKATSSQEWTSRKSAVKDQLPPKTPAGGMGFSGIAEYPLLSSPPFWSSCPPFPSDTVSATILSLHLSPTAANGDIARISPCRQLCLLTTRPFPLYQKSQSIDVAVTVGHPEVRAIMRLHNGGPMKPMSERKMRHALAFTQRLLRAELQKPVSAELDKIKWMVLPLKKDSELQSTSTGKKGSFQFDRHDIAWDEVIAINKGPVTTPFDVDDPDELKKQCEDAMTTNSSEFARRFYIKTLRQDLSPSSPLPNCLDGGELSIFEFLTEKAKENLYPPPVHSNQPILEVEIVNPVKSGGYIITSSLDADDEKIRSQFLIPEFTNRHCIPASIFRTASTLPPMFHFLEDMLVAYEMKRSIFHSKLDNQLATQATTATAAVTHHEGNYERLEILGDNLLKLITTVHAYTTETASTMDVEHSMQKRHVMSSNRTLQANAMGVGLAKFIRTKRYRAKDWLPRDWKLDWSEWGEQANENQSSAKVLPGSSEVKYDTHRIGDKVLADVVEALIGAAYLPEKNIDDVITAMHHLGIPITGLNKWSDSTDLLPAAKGQKGKETKGFMKAFKPASSQVLGYTFKDDARGLEVFSLTMNGDRKKVYDRYKMLGNALYDYFVLEYLWETYPSEGPGSLTNMKTTRVSEGARSALAIELGLVDKLCDGDDQTRTSIAKTKKAFKAAKVKGDSRSNKMDAEDEGIHYWSEVATSQLLSNLPEALLGAILHDSSFSLSTTRQVFEEKYQPFLEKYCRGPHGHDSHPKSQLSRFMQSFNCTNWGIEKVFKGDGKEEAVFTLHSKQLVRAKGITPSLAVRAACTQALNLLNTDGGGRLKELCDCTIPTALATIDQPACTTVAVPGAKANANK